MSQRDAQRTLLARQSTSYLQKAKNGYIFILCIRCPGIAGGGGARGNTLSERRDATAARVATRERDAAQTRGGAKQTRVCVHRERAHPRRNHASACVPRRGGRRRAGDAPASARGATDRRGVSRGISGRTGAECTSQASRGEGVGLSAPSGGGHAREEHAADRDLLLGADVLEDHRARLVARLERRRARDVVAVPELTVREAVLDGERLHDARDAKKRGGLSVASRRRRRRRRAEPRRQSTPPPRPRHATNGGRQPPRCERARRASRARKRFRDASARRRGRATIGYLAPIAASSRRRRASLTFVSLSSQRSPPPRSFVRAHRVRMWFGSQRATVRWEGPLTST